MSCGALLFGGLVGAARLLSVPRIHPAVQLVVMEPDGRSRTGCPEPICLHGAIDSGPLAATVAGRLLVSQVWTVHHRCFHWLSLRAVCHRLHITTTHGILYV